MSEMTATIKPNGLAQMTPSLLETALRSDTGSEPRGVPVTRITRADATVGPAITFESVEDRYPVSDALSRQFGTALRLLREAETFAQRSMEAHQNSNLLLADDSIYAIKSLLPELFFCRTIGDGFGLVIAALMSVFENKRGQPFDRVQINALSQCIKVLRAKPLIQPDSADQLVQTLESAGLDPDPAGLCDLVNSMIPDA